LTSHQRHIPHHYISNIPPYHLDIINMSNWQDRRFMGSTGKHVHEPGRKTSFSSANAAKPGGISTLPTTAQGEHASRFMYMSGKQVHEPTRKSSIGDKAADAAKAVAAAVTPSSPTSTSTTGSGTAGAIAGRRRVGLPFFVSFGDLAPS
jgi:hypothetical protein